GTSSISLWDWDFDDGTGSSDSDPDHVYEHSGVYAVTLRANDGSLWSSASDPASRGFVRVAKDAPVDVGIEARAPYGGDADLSDPAIDVQFALAGGPNQMTGGIHL